MKNGEHSSGKMLSFARRALTVLVGFAVVVMLMGAGCNGKYTQEEYDEALKESYNSGWYAGYEEGERDGLVKGENKGQKVGIAEGKEAGRREGLKEGEKKGYNDGYIAGSLWRVKDLSFSILGAVLVVVLFVFLLWLLQSLTRKYRERIGTWYKYRIDKHLVRDSLARAIAASGTTEINLGDRKLSLDILERRKSILEKAFLNRTLIDLKRKSEEGSFESGKILNECLIKLSEAQSLIDDVSLIFEHSSEEIQVDLMKDFLEILQNDKSWPIESRMNIISQIEQKYSTDAE